MGTKRLGKGRVTVGYLIKRGAYFETRSSSVRIGGGRISGTMAPDMRFSYVGVSVVLTLPWSPYLTYSTPINASSITSAASYRLPINSSSSSENSSSYLASKNSSSSIPMTINALLNSYADASETPETRVHKNKAPVTDLEESR